MESSPLVQVKNIAPDSDTKSPARISEENNGSISLEKPSHLVTIVFGVILLLIYVMIVSENQSSPFSRSKEKSDVGATAA